MDPKKEHLQVAKMSVSDSAEQKRIGRMYVKDIGLCYLGLAFTKLKRE